MALNYQDLNNIIQIGNRDDYCYLCAKEINAKSEMDYNKQFNNLKGKLEAKKIVKIRRSGTEICICLDHIHQIAKENPLPKELEE